jgi:hypothetical protein
MGLSVLDIFCLTNIHKFCPDLLSQRKCNYALCACFIYVVIYKFNSFHTGIFIQGKSGYDEDVIILKDESNENHRVSTSQFSVGLCVCVYFSFFLLLKVVSMLTAKPPTVSGLNIFL